MGDRQTVGHVVRRVVVAGHRGRGRPTEVVVERLTEALVAVQAGVCERLVEAEDGPAVHLLVRSVATVDPHDRGLVPEMRGVVGRSAECLDPIRGEAFGVLRVIAVAEGVVHDLVRHHPGVPGMGQPQDPFGPSGSSYTVCTGADAATSSARAAGGVGHLCAPALGASRQVGSVVVDEAVVDLVGANLRVLFCGINPGMRSGELGLHFARPGNRFWKLLHAGGFTASVLSPAEQRTLPSLGIGITNLVGRVTAAASDLTVAELREGATELEAKVEVLRPRCVAVLGLQAYRTAFRRPGATIGSQPELLGHARLWLLPNPSGLQARYQMPEMNEMFKALFVATEVA